MTHILLRSSRHLILRATLAFAALLALALLPAGAETAPPKRTILLVEVENTLTIRLQYYFPVGSVQETIPGVAHYVEHTKFKHDGGAKAAAFSAVAGSQFNASTTHRFTRYELGTTPKGFAAALDFLASLHEPLKLSPGDMETERSIIQQELAQRMNANPDTPFFLDFNQQVLSGSYLARWPGGTPEDIAKVTREEVKAFADKYYPDASTFLVIVGRPLRDVDLASLKAHFPDAAVARVRVPPDRKVVIDDAALAGFSDFLPPEPDATFPSDPVSVHKLSAFAKADTYVYLRLIKGPTGLDQLVAGRLLDNAIESRLPEGLHDLLAEDAALINDPSVSLNEAQEGWWVFTLRGTLLPGVKPAQVRAVIDAYLPELAKNGISEKSFERLKKRFFLRDEWEDPGSRATVIGGDTVNQGYDYATRWKERMRSLTREEVNALAASLAQPVRVGEAHLEAER
ncbi:MAG: insulinase family protein [Proteobacteria bacterium]|nr:insulinase family protein [Pseudomonadota bacterium]